MITLHLCLEIHSINSFTLNSTESSSKYTVGSSTKMTLGSQSIALANDKRCFFVHRKD